MEGAVVGNLLMPAIYLHHLRRGFADTTRLLGGTDLDFNGMAAPSCRITVRDDLRCIVNANTLAGNPFWYHDWGIMIAEHFHGPLTPAWLTAPTLGAGLDAFLRYFPNRIPYMGLQSRTEDGCLVIELRPLADFRELLPILIEIPFLILQQYIKTILNTTLAEAVVELGYEAPIYHRAYDKSFECSVRFDRQRHAMLIPLHWLAVPNLAHEDWAWRSAIRKCEEDRQRGLSERIINHVRSELYEAFDGNDLNAMMPTLEGVAASLHMSPRTLIRRLRELGTSFYGERDELRKLKARDLVVGSSLSVAEVAAALKFTDPPNFGKAFRRWFGESPSEFRRRGRH